MDPEHFDTVTADTLMPGDLIDFNGFFTVDRIEDTGDLILIYTIDDDAPITVEPDDRIDLYAYPQVSID